MTEQPSPLVPPECDLRDFAFMPLQVLRLRRSKAWLKCKRNPALAFYMVNLWTASWHDLPAGSLEDDNDVLADLAMCDPAKWDKLRSDVLHGWVKGEDGRLYNPTVCEQARAAWDSKLDQRWRTECARIKKHADRYKIKLARPTFDEWMSAGCPQGQRLPVPRDTEGTPEGQFGETASKGQGEGQEQGEGQGQGDLNTSVPIGTGGQPPIDRPVERLPEAETAEKRKARLWRAGKSLLNTAADMPIAQCGTYIGALVAKFGEVITLNAMEAAVLERPADPVAWINAACQHAKGDRVAAEPAWKTEERDRMAAFAGPAAARRPGTNTKEIFDVDARIVG